MFRIRDFNAGSGTSQLLEKPLKEWRSKYESNSLTSADIMLFFQLTSPHFLTIDQTAEYSELGKKGSRIDFLI